VRGAVAAALTAAGLVSLAGCGGGSNDVSAKHLRELVLRQADVGAAFSPFYIGRQIRLDTAGTSRSDAVRFGRKGGWIARYHRPGSASTQGPLVIESRADLFGGSGGASSDLDAYRHDLEHVPAAGVRHFAVAGLGDEALGVTYVRPGSLPVRTYTIVWRDRNVSASVTAQGFDGKLRKAAALRLARAQERLISRA
jgi:hypothetical protein